MVGPPTPGRAVHVVGAGGIGIPLAWSLSRAGWPVTLVDAHPGKVASAARDGIAVGGHPPAALAILDFAHWVPEPRSIVLLCTKTYDNAEVLRKLPDSAFLVPVQNGFDLELDARGHAGEAIASFVSECERDRPATRITRPGSLHIGRRRKSTPAEDGTLAAIAGALRAGGLFRVEEVRAIRPYKATKLMYNAAISPLAAAAGIDNGELLTDPLARRLFFGLLQENYAILRAAREPLARIGPFHPVVVARILRTPGLPALMANFFRPSLRGTYCSMAPDIATGRTEVAAYNGHLVRLAGDRPCPFNRAAVGLLESIVSERRGPARANLDAFAALLPAGAL